MKFAFQETIDRARRPPISPPFSGPAFARRGADDYPRRAQAAIGDAGSFRPVHRDVHRTDGVDRISASCVRTEASSRRSLRDRRILAGAPHIDVVALVENVALAVESDWAHHRVDRLAILERCSDLRPIVRPGPLDSVGDCLNDAVAEQGETLRIETLGLNCSSALAALGERRGSVGRVKSVPFARGPARNSEVAMLPPVMSWNFAPWSATWRRIRPASAWEPPK